MAIKNKMILLHPQLEVFVAVAKCKSMHGAAKAVHLTQTAITQRIHILERRLQTTLFIRTRQGVQLTSDGDALLRYCNTITDLQGETLSKIKGAGLDSTVRVCINGPTSIMASRIIPLCLPVMKMYPKLLVNFDANDSENRIKLLQMGLSHFVIIEPEYVLKEMEVKKLLPEKYILVCSKRWKNRDLHDIIQTERIIDFEEPDQITLNYLKHHRLFHLAQHERHFVNRNESLVRMLIDGYGYGVLTKEFCKSFLNDKQLIMLNSGKVYSHQLVLAWYKRHEPPKYFSNLIQAIN